MMVKLRLPLGDRCKSKLLCVSGNSIAFLNVWRPPQPFNTILTVVNSRTGYKLGL